eukprot:5712479-Alexandrium_andersonii.AAC.1
MCIRDRPHTAPHHTAPHHTAPHHASRPKLAPDCILPTTCWSPPPRTRRMLCDTGAPTFSPPPSPSRQ